MIDALVTLTTWLSPAYPVGAYTYSHGLEQAVEVGTVRDAATAKEWIAGCTAHGTGPSDVILLSHAWQANGDRATLQDLSDLAVALAPSAERRLEAEAQGRAFAQTTAAAYGGDDVPHAYPVAIGAAARAHGIPLDQTAALFLHAFAANLVSAAVRLVPLGQTDGQKILADLAPMIRDTAGAAISASLDDLGGCAILSDIAAMHHETQTVRLFRT